MKKLIFHNIQQKTPVLESPFNLEYCEIFIRAPILKNICKGLLLKIYSWSWEKLKIFDKAGLFKRLFCVGELVKITICLKLVTIILELWYVSTHIYVVSENIAFSTRTFLILLMSADYAFRTRFPDCS